MHGSAFAIDEPQVAIAEDDGFWPCPWEKATVSARLTGGPNCTALATFEQARVVTGSQSCTMRWTFGTLVCFQSPFDPVFDKTMLEHGAGMVEHDCIDLTGRGPQHAVPSSVVLEFGDAISGISVPRSGSEVNWLIDGLCCRCASHRPCACST